MDELKELKDLINGNKEENIVALENLSDPKEIEKRLQEIGYELVDNCLLEVCGLKIKPLWVEAYYYNAKKFPDCNAHCDKKQKSFAKLYFHKMSPNRAGFDLCLSKGDYYLSFLLKATVINDIYCTQTGIHKILEELHLDKSEIEKHPVKISNTNSKDNLHIEYAPRVGVPKPCFKEEKLAIFQMEALSNRNYDFTFAHNVLIPLAEKTMREYKNNHKDCSKQEFNNKCTEIFGWMPDKVRQLWSE